jgi:phosphoribosylformylglycinamidine cyclo-ligase
VTEERGTYAASGVDLEAADAAVEAIRPHVERTHGAEVLSAIGGFAGLFRFDTRRYKRPVLVAATDGVGTKLELARQLDRHEGIGVDLVAMVVDDLVVPGAEPLFFNDYLSVGKLHPERVAEVVRGIAAGCEEAGCALVGGETAEHPGLLDHDAFDLAGFGVGVVERERILGPHRVRDGDVLVAMAASGLHSNGYSLVRRIVDDLDLSAAHGLDRPLGEELLEPTRIYAADVLALIDAIDVHALCHVTGGGLPGNLPRVLPPGTVATVDAGTWERPPIVRWLQERGPVDDDQLWRTFNCGVGMVAIVPSGEADRAVSLLGERGLPTWVAGTVDAGPAADAPAQVRITRRG